MMRSDGRGPLDPRPVSMETDVQVHAEGSVVIATGLTRVLCAVSVEERVPGWLRGSRSGWVTAEYAMLPRSTTTRTPRERGSAGGRSQEIQRLIGRSLRAVTDLSAFGERTFTVDCDVLQADGGTQTAAISGAYVALYLAMDRMVRDGQLASVPLTAAVAATSVGLLNETVLLDLCYEEDAAADVDANVVRTSAGEYVEVQATAEGKTFPRASLAELLDAADAGIARMFAEQQAVIDRVVAARGTAPN